jgi:hypothetical protein
MGSAGVPIVPNIGFLQIELIEAGERALAYSEGQNQELPVVEGEYALEGAYHYYPELGQVRGWASRASFSVIEVSTRFSML